MDYKEKKFPTEIRYIGIDSRFRDKEKYPLASQYRFELETVLQNVVSVELVFAVYEQVEDETYVNLNIDELSPNLLANANHISASLCQLPMTQPLNTYDSSMYSCKKYFEKAMLKLSKLSISFLGSNGKLCNMPEHFLRFQVECLKFVGKEFVNNEIITQGVNVLQLKAPKHIGDVPLPNINVPEKYTMDILKTAFKSAANILRSYDIPSSLYQQKYNELRNKFKILAANVIDK